MATVEFAKYHEAFVLNNLPNEVIIDEASTLWPDEYDDEIHYRKIFCPKCKIPLKRTPKIENKTTAGIDAFFSHFKSDIKCDWHMKTTPGKKYLNEEDTWQAIEDQNLTVLTEWSNYSDDDVINFESSPIYNGINEDPYSDDATNKVLGRYRNGEVPLANRITSVYTLAKNINVYKYKSIILPGRDRAIEIQSLLQALDDDKFKIDNDNYLFFGRVNSFIIGDEKKGNFDFINIRNNFQKTRIYVPKMISNSRKFTEGTTRDRVIIVYGKLVFKNNRYVIYVQHLGKISYVPKEKERYFWYRKN